MTTAEIGFDLGAYDARRVLGRAPRSACSTCFADDDLASILSRSVELW